MILKYDSLALILSRLKWVASMLHDRAFDSGIITIAEDMTISVSPEYAANADHFFNSALLAYNGKMIELPEKFQPHWEFIDYHRQYVFKA